MDDDKDKKQPPILICMPWSQRHMARHSAITKALCMVCRGEVFYNTATGLPPDVTHINPICGACAIDLIDADEAAGEKHQFALTEPQAAGRGGINAEVLQRVKEMGMERMSKWALDAIRADRARYDARPSARHGVN